MNRRIWSTGIILLLPLAGCGGKPVDEISATVTPDAELPVRPAVDAADWPWWRGEHLDGKAVDTAPPVEWSADKNIVWKADVPGRGHASPTVFGGRVFVATADEDAEKIQLLCFDGESGKQLWDTELYTGGFMHRHKKNSHASPTPACDGKYVYLPIMIEHNGQPGIWVTAVDFDGKIVWNKLAGPFRPQHGYGSSPVLYRDTVIIAGDNSSSGFLAAMDTKTGDIRWRIRREGSSYSTPVVAQIAGRMQLVIHGNHQVTSYNPDNGDVLWSASGPARTCANTVAFDGERVYASGGYPEKELLAIKADGSGDVTSSHVLWRDEKSVAYVPSMLIDDGRLYAVQDTGVVTCYQAATGEVLWRDRLGGNYSASPVLAAGNLYFASEDGMVHVVKTGDEFESVAENDLGDGIMASPVVVGDRIYLRTNHHLYCISNQTGE